MVMNNVGNRKEFICLEEILAIQWIDNDESEVADILENYPTTSNQCAEAARLILPIAIRTDADSCPKHIKPIRGRFVCCKIASGWFHHVTTSLQAHFVDALTGSSGWVVSSYLERYFEYPDGVEIVDADLSDPEL